MDDSLLALLSPEVASEAHDLRRELESRRRVIQERFLTLHSTNTDAALSRIIQSVGGKHVILHYLNEFQTIMCYVFIRKLDILIEGFNKCVLFIST